MVLDRMERMVETSRVVFGKMMHEGNNALQAVDQYSVCSRM